MFKILGLIAFVGIVLYGWYDGWEKKNRRKFLKEQAEKEIDRKMAAEERGEDINDDSAPSVL